MAKVVVTKSKLDSLAQHINTKAGTTGAKNIAQMQSAVDGIAKKETVEWHQCPEMVRSYLANVTYSPSDYSTSQIDTYLTNVPTDSYPVGKTVDGVALHKSDTDIDGYRRQHLQRHRVHDRLPYQFFRQRSDCCERGRSGGLLCDWVYPGQGRRCHPVPGSVH